MEASFDEEKNHIPKTEKDRIVKAYTHLNIDSATVQKWETDERGRRDTKLRIGLNPRHIERAADRTYHFLQEIPPGVNPANGRKPFVKGAKWKGRQNMHVYIHEDLKKAPAWKGGKEGNEDDVGALVYNSSTGTWQPWSRNMQVRKSATVFEVVSFVSPF